MQIKVIFLKNCDINRYTIDAANKLNSKGLYSIDCSIYENEEDIKEYNYELINKLIIIYNKYKDNFDYVLILNENTAVLDFFTFFKYLEELNFHNKIFAFRILDIKGIMMKYGPRVPFIDDTIITINLNMAKKMNYFERKLINGCHFYKYAKEHALLQSLIEYSLSDDEFINIANQDNIKDEYGKKNKNYFPFPFSFSTDTLIINADLNYNDKYINILNDLKNRENEGGMEVYFKENRISSYIYKLMNFINFLVGKIANKEFKKSFDEK